MISFNIQHCDRRSWKALPFGFILLGLVGCERSLDLKITETKLKEDLTKQGVASLKQVTCPEALPVGKSFTCTGFFESGIGFSIPVQHQEEGDKLNAEIPSIKGMLNMDHLMKTIREELKMGDGEIDCSMSSTYRMVTLGNAFECSLVAKTALSTPIPAETPEKTKADKLQSDLGKLPLPAVKEPEKIEIAIAASGDVTWQRLVPAGPNAKLGLPGDSKSNLNAAPSDPNSSSTDPKSTPQSTPSDPKSTDHSNPKASPTKPASTPDEDVPYDS